VPHLALPQLAAAPGRAAIALAGILASFTLMVAMAIMVASFRDSLERWLDRVLPADLYLRAATVGDSGYLSGAVQRAILATPGVAHAEFQRITQIELDPARPPVALIARAIDPADPGARLVLVGTPLAPGRLDPVRAWVSEAMVDLYGFRVGRRVSLPLAGKTVTVLVAGVWRDYARQYGALVMSEVDYRRLTGDAEVNDAALWLAPGTGLAEATARLRAAIPGSERLQFATPGEIRARSLGIFDRSFAVTYLLEGVAMVIGLIGIGAGFSGQALARAGEFGMLRHVGMTRRQIGGVLALEGALLTGLGCLAGLVLGLAIALILIEVVNPESFHWRMQLAIPWGLLATVALVLVASAALTALASGRGAMSVRAVRAVREDW
jgi:putative ABC transport system permease protein